jgi:hypothetical protein
MRAARKKLTQAWGTIIPLAATLAVMSGSALAQSNPLMPKMSLGGQEKKALTPEEQEKQRQTANDPWATVRPAPKKKPQ